MTTTRADVAAKVSQILGSNAILVGHSIHHDMRSLQLDHWPVIDTAHVYAYRNVPEYSPALAHLSDVILAQKLRVDGMPHDARKDAFAAMQLVQHAMLPGAGLEIDGGAVKVRPVLPLQPKYRFGHPEKCLFLLSKNTLEDQNISKK